MSKYEVLGSDNALSGESDSVFNDVVGEADVSDEDVSDEHIVVDEGSEADLQAELEHYFDLIVGGNFLGRTFQTTEHAFAAYNAYAKAAGFSVRKDGCHKFKGTDLIRDRTFICSNAGHRNRKHIENPDRQRAHRSLTRCGCTAKITLYYNHTNNNYVVRHFHAEHNHDMVIPAFSSELRSHRKVDQASLAQAKALRLSGVGTSKVMNHFTAELGGYDKVGFTRKDLYNALDRDRKNEIEFGDSNASLAWLEGRGEGDKSFFFRHTVDDSNCLDKLFFTDERSMEEYKVFGDCLLFDATYKTNGYRFPLVILSGVNNHRNTCVFATALVQNETTETYVWVLTNLVQAMGGRRPNTVITDGDRSMHAAIKTVFPNAIHRSCLWHLQRNAATNVKKVKDFNIIFKAHAELDCPTYVFDRRWFEMVDKYGLRKNKWIEDVFNIRQMWAEPYLRGIFFADCRSTQRCEGLNAMLKKAYDDRSSTFIKFLKSYFRWLGSLRVTTITAEYKSNYTTEILTTPLQEIEAHALRIFTRNIFLRFRDNIVAQGALHHAEITIATYQNTHTYNVLDHGNPGVTRTTTYHASANHFQCDCRFFESVGYPCKHIIYVMKCVGVNNIPDSCYNLRWTPGISSHLRDLNLKEIFSSAREMIRHGFLNSKAKEMISVAMKTENGTKKAAHTMEKLIDFCNKRCHEEEKDLEIEGNDGSGKCTYDVGDPSNARPKGSRSLNKQRAPPRCGHCRYIQFFVK
jgi:zinc finger SWIM domain-containing protein 3